MNLYCLDYEIHCGEYEFITSKYMLFDNDEDAWRYAERREVEYNANELLTYSNEEMNDLLKDITEEKRDDIKKIAASTGCYYELYSVEVVDEMYNDGRRYLIIPHWVYRDILPVED